MKKIYYIFLCCIIAIGLKAEIPSNFIEAKIKLVAMYKQLGKEFQKDFYCRAPFKITARGLIVQPSDNYTPRKTKTTTLDKNKKKQKKKKKRKGGVQIASFKNNKENKTSNNLKRHKRIEWEHIMPAQNFGQHFPCWREAKEKGLNSRQYCSKTDPKFSKMEADLFNLVPAIGQINGDRSNYRYAEGLVGMTFGQYGKCKVKSDPSNKRFYPANYSKGFIARTYLYMSKKYNIRLSKQERRLMIAWDKTYPMTKQERKIRRLTSKIMGEKFTY